MNDRMKRLSFLIITGLGGVLFFIAAQMLGCEGKRVVDDSTFPRVTGAWFVRYASDPNPYLDVAVADETGIGIKRVVADLKGPRKTYQHLDLAYNRADREWQKVCDFLPPKLEGGLWWVSRIKVEADSGSWAEYTAAEPYSAYRFTFGDTRGNRAEKQNSRVWIGAFYATEEGAPIYYISTLPVKGKKKIDPVMYLYRADDPLHWIAISDDPDVEVVYPRIALPLTPGETVYIRIESLRRDVGEYAVVVNDTGFVTEAAAGITAPDIYEPNNDYRRATKISLGERQNHSLSTNDEIDWLVLAVPSTGEAR